MPAKNGKMRETDVATAKELFHTIQKRILKC